MLRLFWIISLQCIDSISPDCWQTMAPLVRLRANWLLFVKLPLYKRNNASILPQVLWMQPGRHTWAPWSLAIYRLWCTVQLFQFVSVGFFFFFFLYCVFPRMKLLSETKKEVHLTNGKCFHILDSWLRTLQAPPHPAPPPLTFLSRQRMSNVWAWSFELLCMIYMHSCI